MNRLSYRDKLYQMSTSNGSMQDLITRINLNQNIAIMVKQIEQPPYIPYRYKGSTTILRRSSAKRYGNVQSNM